MIDRRFVSWNIHTIVETLFVAAARGINQRVVEQLRLSCKHWINSLVFAGDAGNLGILVCLEM